METALGVLAAAGLDDDEAVEVFADVQTVTVGFTSLELARRSATGSADAERARRAATIPDERSPQFWPTFVATLPDDRCPDLVRSSPDLVAFTSAGRLQDALRALLDGIGPRRRQRSAARPQGGP